MRGGLAWEAHSGRPRGRAGPKEPGMASKVEVQHLARRLVTVVSALATNLVYAARLTGPAPSYQALEAASSSSARREQESTSMRRFKSQQQNMPVPKSSRLHTFLI